MLWGALLQDDHKQDDKQDDQTNWSQTSQSFGGDDLRSPYRGDNHNNHKQANHVVLTMI